MSNAISTTGIFSKRRFGSSRRIREVITRSENVSHCSFSSANDRNFRDVLIGHSSRGVQNVRLKLIAVLVDPAHCDGINLRGVIVS